MHTTISGVLSLITTLTVSLVGGTEESATINTVVTTTTATIQTAIGPVLQGPKGDAGPGLPVGGTVGQVPVKASLTDYDVAWGDPAGAASHAGLSGLDADDHTQYLTEARGDARYYTETETDTLLSGKAASVHSHNDLYYTETETDTLLTGKAAATHDHDADYAPIAAGVPAGGETSAIPRKASATDHDVAWSTVLVDAKGTLRAKGVAGPGATHGRGVLWSRWRDGEAPTGLSGYLSIVLGGGYDGGLFAVARTNTAKPPFTALSGWEGSDGGPRVLYFGGGGWGAPDATEQLFYTAPINDTNDQGVLRLALRERGTVEIGSAPAVAGATPAQVHIATTSEDAGLQWRAALGGHRVTAGIDRSESRWQLSVPESTTTLMGDANEVVVLSFGSKYASVTDVVINEGAKDLNLRAEGTTDPNLLFVDAGQDFVGIGTSTPTSKLDVVGATTQRGMSADPADPPAGASVTWVSDGTGTGAAGETWSKITVGATTYTVKLADSNGVAVPATVTQAEHNHGNLGAAITLDIAQGNKQRGVVNASVTITLPAAPTTAAYMRLRLVNSGAGNVITVSGASHIGTASPTLTTADAGVNVLTFDGNPDGWIYSGAAVA